MKKYLFLLITLSCLFTTASAQQSTLKTYDWSESIEYPVFTDTSQNILGLMTVIKDEFAFNQYNEFKKFKLRHYKVQLLSDEEIESYNKIYIPTYASNILHASKARVLNPDGSLIELKKSDIILAVDEETDRNVNYFALEGIQKGAVVEYYYLIESEIYVQGTRVDIQKDYKQEDVTFELIHPNFLIFRSKSYNQLEESSLLMEMKDYNILGFHEDKIDPLYEETYGNYDANRQFLIYCMDSNPKNAVWDYSSYSKLVEPQMEYFYENVSKSDIRSITKIIKASKANEASSTEDKIRTLEDYLKRNYSFVERGNAAHSKLSEVLDKKVGGLRGITKLFVNCLKQMGIEHQIVLTNNRKDLKFDPEFEAYLFLDTYALYIPSINKYMSPTSLGSRIGYLPFGYIHNHGLFFEKLKLGSVESFIGNIKYIPENDHKDSYSNITAHVKFDKEDVSNILLDLKKEEFGYSASYQLYYDIMDQEIKEDIEKSHVESINENFTVDMANFTNTMPQDFGKKPYTMSLKTETEEFVDRAGNKYLFKVGNLIGPQNELYQETERIQPVDSGYNKSYTRKLVIEIPEGYSIKNMEDLNIHAEVKEDDEIKMIFKSSYELVNNELIINIEEFYQQIEVSTEDYNPYREVINSAADFNKVVLILEQD